MATKETGIQFLARLGTRPPIAGIEAILFDQGPHSKDVIEIYGSEGTGKTEMLLHLLLRCILPDQWQGVKFIGCDAGVVYIDLDHKFSILRLAGLMERYILNKANECKEKISIDSNLLETFIGECLKKVHIVRCSSCSQLVITLHTIETLVCNEPGISALMVDSISTFYWMDRSNGGDSIQSQEQNMKLAADMLSKLANTYNLTIFATKCDVFKKKGYDCFADGANVGDSNKIISKVSDDLELEHVEFMCKPWQRCVTHRLVVVKVLDMDNIKQPTFVVGGDYVHGNTQFVITGAGIQFLKS